MTDHQARKERRQRKKRRQKLQRNLKQKRQSEDRQHRVNPVVGYVARRGMDVVCIDEQRCVVTGNRSAMKSFIENHGNRADDYVIERAGLQLEPMEHKDAGSEGIYLVHLGSNRYLP